LIKKTKKLTKKTKKEHSCKQFHLLSFQTLNLILQLLCWFISFFPVSWKLGLRSQFLLQFRYLQQHEKKNTHHGLTLTITFAFILPMQTNVYLIFK